METVRTLPTLPSHSPATNNTRINSMQTSYGQTPSRPPSQQSSGTLQHTHVGRAQVLQTSDNSPYKVRALSLTGGPGSGGGGNGSGSSGGVNLVSASHLLQVSHGPLNTDPVSPPPPPVSHSNLSQVARNHPYAAALPAPPPPSRMNIGPYTGQSTMPSAYGNSTTYSRSDQPQFPIRSPPDRPSRRLTLLPHSVIGPMDYTGGAGGIGGPGPGSGRHPIQPIFTQIQYSPTPGDSYRDPLSLPISQGESSRKKMRYGVGEPLLMKATVSQPLRVDTRPITVAAVTSGVSAAPVNREGREQSAYIPQVEAISPTLPGDNDDLLKIDDSPLRSTKDDLLQQITKVDREIAKVENNISKLKKKQQDLEEAAKKPPPEHAELSTHSTRPKNQSVAQLIYAENRRKAAAAHQTLAALGPIVDLPLYHQPSDTQIYHRNRTQYLTFRPRLLKFLRRRQKEKEARHRYLTMTYNKYMNEWVKRVSDIEKISNGPVTTATSTASTPGTAATTTSGFVGTQPANTGNNAIVGRKKEREYYEKVFPELRKQREDRERFTRVGARIKSDADLEEIMDGLQEQENEDKKMRSLAVVPPVLMDTRERRLRFDNRNGLVEDPMTEYRERSLLNIWSEQEKEIFKEKYLQHPKNFVTIASCLERKSVADCIQFYYLSKKTVNYKQLLRKTKMKRSTRGAMQKPNAATAAAAAAAAAQNQSQGITDMVTPGVTTRLQREQQMRQEVQTTSCHVSGVSSTITSTSSVASATTTTTVETVITTSAAPTTVLSQDDASSIPMEVDPAAGSDKDVRRDRRRDGTSAADSTDEDEDVNSNSTVSVGGGGPHPCIVCKTMLEHHGQSRPLPKHQAAQYGLQESDVNQEARVCSACRCRVVRRRYVQCPLPTCPTSKRRVKRLRPLPNKWNELQSDIRKALETEFQIGRDVTKCCSTCCNRITRKLAALSGNSIATSTEGFSTLSSGEEISGSSSSGEDDGHSDTEPVVDAEERKADSVEQRPVEATEPRATDNSETDSADEVGANTATHAEPLALNVSSSPVLQSNGNNGQEPLTVKDLMLGVIEKQLRRNDSHASPTPSGLGTPTHPPGPSESPTITSILKDSRSYAVGRNIVTGVPSTASTPPTRQLLQAEGKQQQIIVELSPLQNQSRLPSPYPAPNIGQQHHTVPQYGPPETEYNPSLPREGLAVLHVQQAVRDYERERARMQRDVIPVEGQTLDLSMPKKRDSKDTLSIPPSAPHILGVPSGSYSSLPPPPAHSKASKEPFRNASTVIEPIPTYSTGMRAPVPYPPRSTPPAPSSRPTSGSIMQGTPLASAAPVSVPIPNVQVARADGLLRTAPPGREIGGSITQGTPIAITKETPPSGHPSYERTSPSGFYKGLPPSQQAGVPRGPYPADQQISSRQIILSDYLTSQHMPGGNNARREREPLPPPPPQNPQTPRGAERPSAAPHAMYQYRPTSPMYYPKLPGYVDPHHSYQPPVSSTSTVAHPSQPPPQQQRQGVIQRTSSIPASRPTEPRPSPPTSGIIHSNHQQQGRTASPAGHLAHVGGAYSNRPQVSVPVSIPPRTDSSIYVHDAFASLVNAAVAQPSLPVPERDRRDRERDREKDRDQRQHTPGPPPRLVPDRREESLERMSLFHRESPKVVAGPPLSNPNSSNNDSTLTAASLIDAIITHQINQSSNPNEPGSAGSKTAADLFNRYRRNVSPVDPRQQKERMDDSVASANKGSITLGEHINSIITNDFHQGSNPATGGNESEWDRDWNRRQLDFLKRPVNEGVINDYSKNRNPAAPMDFTFKPRSIEGAVSDYGPSRVLEPEGRPPISPLDYVKNRIVEVMRTSSDGVGATNEMGPPHSPARRGVSPAPSPSKRPRMNQEEERGGPSPSAGVASHFIPAPYPTMGGYTYSIPPNVPISNSAVAPTSSAAGNQPVVVLSSQYEPLSDED